VLQHPTVDDSHQPGCINYQPIVTVTIYHYRLVLKFDNSRLFYLRTGSDNPIIVVGLKLLSDNYGPTMIVCSVIVGVRFIVPTS
jgi:hypothetical protein